MKKLPKILVGSHAYKGYKLEMMRSKFGGWSDGIGWEFDTWNNWRENDGMLCRNDKDCKWLNPKLMCENWDDPPTNLNDGWFGGASSYSILGECACPAGTYFNDDQISCIFYAFDESLGIFKIIGLILSIIILLIIACHYKRLVRFFCRNEQNP